MTTTVDLTLDDGFAAAGGGVPLQDATFVIVDLETTGGTAADHSITEIGAVKVRGGQVLGEFRTFVNPGVPIPPFITVLTGITDALVADAPPIGAALPAFLEFAGFAGRDPALPILVAHNAGFDAGFLKAACLATQTPWPNPLIMDTVRLARRVLRNGEVRNHKLGTLAPYFGAQTTPTHRALDDARATVDVLHGLIARVGNLGVHDVNSLLVFEGQPTESRRRKRHLADNIPTGPGVYVFHDVKDRPLYVGVSVNVRARVMSYFTAADSRRKITQMVEMAQRVSAIICHTPLEARVRELRMIDEHRPRFNHRSSRPERTIWLTVTDERYPRLSMVRHGNLTDARRVTVGPFTSAQSARDAMDAVHDIFPIRQCTQRLTAKHTGSPCILLDMGRCHGPCVRPNVASSYAHIVTELGAALLGDAAVLESQLAQRMAALAAEQRYEEAAVARDRLTSLTSAISRSAALRALRVIPELVAASPGRNGGWDVHVVRHGWLAGAAHVAQADQVLPTAAALAQTAATLPAETLIAESELLLTWLSSGATRLIDITADHSWHMPLAARPYCVARAVDTETSRESASAPAPESIEA